MPKNQQIKYVLFLFLHLAAMWPGRAFLYVFLHILTKASLAHGASVNPDCVCILMVSYSTVVLPNLLGRLRRRHTFCSTKHAAACCQRDQVVPTYVCLLPPCILLCW